MLLLISGGHCQLLVVESVGRYTQLGTTRDDAVGRSFDKVAKMLGLGYPGGPAVEQAACLGDASRFSFPRPLKGQPGCDFSFSGLKTHVRQTVDALPPGPFVKYGSGRYCRVISGSCCRYSCRSYAWSDCTVLPPMAGRTTCGCGWRVAANDVIRNKLHQVVK